jgi:YbgC/YbaW family acyl-CoA thioester hydrolase
LREVYELRVEWGDCDPAGIVFYPNFYRWFDSAFQAMLARRGLSQRELARRYGILGTALADTGAAFKAPASYGDALSVESDIGRWTPRSFTIRYRIRRGEEILVEGFETRVFAVRNGSTGRLNGMPIPDEFRALFLEAETQA